MRVTKQDIEDLEKELKKIEDKLDENNERLREIIYLYRLNNKE